MDTLWPTSLRSCEPSSQKPWRERPDHPDVQDATHEVLRRALEAQGSPQQLRAWVAGIARHVAVDVIRRRQVQRLRELSTADSVATEATVLQLSDPRPSPERRLTLTEDAQHLSAALKTLSDSQRRALWLYHVEGAQYREIAEAMNVSLGTVCTWISRARTKVAQYMKERSLA